MTRSARSRRRRAISIGSPLSASRETSRSNSYSADRISASMISTARSFCSRLTRPATRYQQDVARSWGSMLGIRADIPVQRKRVWKDTGLGSPAPLTRCRAWRYSSGHFPTPERGVGSGGSHEERDARDGDGYPRLGRLRLGPHLVDEAGYDALRPGPL